jgi:predicted secreted protein
VLRCYESFSEGDQYPRLTGSGRTTRMGEELIEKSLFGRINMFDDKRSKRIVLVAHCILNQNSISDGTADFPSQFEELVALLMKNGVGIIQLPCPELMCLGLDRSGQVGRSKKALEENSRIRNLMQSNKSTSVLRPLAKEVVKQLEEYTSYHFEIVGIVGVNRSPSCGVETTSMGGREVDGKGVFVEILERELGRRSIETKMIGVKTDRAEDSLESVLDLLRT